MVGNVTYEIVTGTVAEIEAQINELATQGWRGASSVSLYASNLTVILEHSPMAASASSEGRRQALHSENRRGGTQPSQIPTFSHS
jgi:hypothetical protein